MIEILFIWQLCKTIGHMARARGRSVLGWRLILICLLLGCEMTFGVAAQVAGMATRNAYLIAVLGAIVGASTALLTLKFLAPINLKPDHDFTGGFPVVVSQQQGSSEL
jgi:NAD/NADP transhydrogenase beta subunit